MQFVLSKKWFDENFFLETFKKLREGKITDVKDEFLM